MKKRIIGIILLLLFINTISLPAISAEQLSTQLYQAQQKNDDISNLIAKAEKGNTEAQINLGNLYKDEKHFPDQALFWYKKAAEQGNISAQLLLADMYELGIGTFIDHKQSLYWYEKAANSGNPIAQARTGFLYKYGFGVHFTNAEIIQSQISPKYCIQKNEDKANYWFKTAINPLINLANDGNADASYILGMMYGSGNGVKKNNKEKIYWFKKAKSLYEKTEKLGDANASLYLGIIYQYGQGVRRNNKKGMYWLEKASAKGNPLASSHIGFVFESGRYGSIILDFLGLIDYPNAIYWYEKATEQGAEFHSFSLGKMYQKIAEFDLKILKQETFQTQQNYKKAVYWYEKAAEQDSLQAITVLADIYTNMQIFKDYKKAKYYYEKLAEKGDINAKNKADELNIMMLAQKGDSFAQNRLGFLYKNGGLILKSNTQEAFNWFQKSALQGHVESQNSLAWLYYSGNGCESDINKARYWFEKTFNKDIPSEQYKLAMNYSNGSNNFPIDESRANYWLQLSANNGNKIAIDRITYLKEQEQLKYLNEQKEEIAKRQESDNGGFNWGKALAIAGTAAFTAYSANEISNIGGDVSGVFATGLGTAIAIASDGKETTMLQQAANDMTNNSAQAQALDKLNSEKRAQQMQLSNNPNTSSGLQTSYVNVNGKQMPVSVDSEGNIMVTEQEYNQLKSAGYYNKSNTSNVNTSTQLSQVSKANTNTNYSYNFANNINITIFGVYTGDTDPDLPSKYEYTIYHGDNNDTTQGQKLERMVNDMSNRIVNSPRQPVGNIEVYITKNVTFQPKWSEDEIEAHNGYLVVLKEHRRYYIGVSPYSYDDAKQAVINGTHRSSFEIIEKRQF